ncbi:MAG: acetate--CoA ligase family protein, partial [Anaerolineales bacterium]
GQKKIPAAIVISAGFREAGKEGFEREQELIAIAREYHIRLIGPNCLGLIDTQTPLNASFAAGMPPGGPMTFISQSGALGTAVLDIAMAGELGLAKFISLGNKADVSEIELLQYLQDDLSSRVIMIYTEGLPNGQEFIKVSKQVSKKKPIIAIKSGITQSGSRAVASHTGSLAGSEQAYQAAFEQAGILRAESMQDLFDMALAIAYQPPLIGKSIAIVTNAGGPGILATDALERAGLTIARLQIETIQKLESVLPDAASAANPVDVLGDALAERYRIALEIVIQDKNVNGLLVILTPQAMTEIEQTAHVIGNIGSKSTKPILACFMGEAKVKSGIDILNQYHIPNYPFPERAALAFQAMAKSYAILHSTHQSQALDLQIDKKPIEQLLNSIKKENRNAVTESESQLVAKTYGIKTPLSQLATNANEAAEIAQQFGFPVVLKIASPDILHKTDMGGVKINLNSPSEVIDAYELITYRAQRYLPEARIWGCLVQKMAAPGGIEVLLGMNRDPQFGPLLTFGLGGIFVEAIKDVSFRIAPIDHQDAFEMINEIRAHTILDGLRGKPPYDKEAIVDVLLRINQLVLDFPEIAEMDINPLVV